MLRPAVVALSALLALPLAAQAPAGWHERVDRSTSASDPDNTPDIKFVTMGNGFHVTTGPAVTLWKNENTATGAYTLKGRFRLVKPSGHTNYYGLVFGAGGLEGGDQAYLYFLVGQDGSFLVKHRAGAATHDVQAKTPHASVVKPDANGSSTNTLEVRVGADKIDYVVNGTVVHSTPRSGMSARTDGVWGIRVNHQLEVHVDQLAVTK
ncbi:MAG: hypothetical protein IT361_08115 [Gemmatimonadaceae bacterium]|nr:hypothetical protein [Gemmatimonadaceae bacterium]